MSSLADPCPHVEPCGACTGCCQEHHDHEKETGMDPEKIIIGIDRDGKPVEAVLVAEETQAILDCWYPRRCWTWDAAGSGRHGKSDLTALIRAQEQRLNVREDGQ